MTPFVTAGAGFLLAVLWFDLMHDVLVRSGDVIPIAAYYRRVTTAARPMNRLIALVMLGTVVSIVLQIVRDDAPAWVGWTSLVLTVAAVGTGVARTVPNAVRLGTGHDSAEAQLRLARAILRDHLACLVAIVTVLVVQLGFA